MSGRAALQPALAKLVAFAAVVVVVWILGQTMGQVLLVFVVSVLIAMLLNPLVRMLRRLRIPRGPAVLMVFVGFAAAIALSIFVVIAPVRAQVEEIQRKLPAYTDQAKRQADSLQGFFDRHGIDVDVKERADAFLGGLQDRASEAAVIAVTQPAPVDRAMDGPSDPPGGVPTPAFERQPGPEPEPGPGPPSAREDPTRVMDSPELRPGP